MRIPRPTPLGCAVVLAAAIALAWHPRRTPRAGADDRALDRISGRVHGPVLRGRGALVDDVWVWTDATLAPGDLVRIDGRLRTPRGFLDPGAEDRMQSMAAHGAAWELTAVHVERLAEDPDAIDRAWRWAGAVQASWAAKFEAADDGAHHPIDGGATALRGITTGDRGDVPPSLDARWRAVGIFHVLSVSGLHLAVVAGLLFALLRRLAAASPWGGRIRPARWAAPPAIASAIAYTMITGGQLATVRALIVVVLALVGQMLDRPLRLVDALGAAALVILAWRPADLWDSSFQLSFVAALTLALLPRMPPPATAGRIGQLASWLVRGFRTSLWVAITTAPLTAWHFHQVAAGGVIGNLVLTPVVELLALPLALAGLVLHATPLITIAAWLVGRVDDLAGLLARVVPVGHIAIASPLVVVALTALGLVLVAAPGSRLARRGVTAALWLALCATWAFARLTPPADALRVTFLDVGQGDAAIVELPDGAVWLVDAGGNASAHDLAAAAKPGDAVTRALAAYGHDRIDLAIISHPHPDHYLGLAALGVPITEVWAADDSHLDPPKPGRLPSFADLVPHPLHPPLGTQHRDGVALTFYAPELEGTEAADPVRTANDNSLVFTLAFAGRSILFAGDVEIEGEDAVVAAGLPHADIVKVPHHGSPTSSTAAFVAATHPQLAVISCGLANAFGFPSPAVVARWQAAGAEVARTDLDGAIEVTISPSGALAVTRFAQ
jgi:competence protein ComEC